MPPLDSVLGWVAVPHTLGILLGDCSGQPPTHGWSKSLLAVGGSRGLLAAPSWSGYSEQLDHSTVDPAPGRPRWGERLLLPGQRGLRVRGCPPQHVRGLGRPSLLPLCGLGLGGGVVPHALRILLGAKSGRWSIVCGSVAWAEPGILGWPTVHGLGELD